MSIKKDFSWKRTISKNEQLTTIFSGALKDIATGIVVVLIFLSASYYTFSPEIHDLLSGQRVLLEKSRDTSDPIRKLAIEPELLKPQVSPTLKPTEQPTPQPSNSSVATASESEETVEEDDELSTWGKAEQIGEYTWQIKVGSDDRMGTPGEVHQALNEYRQTHSVHALEWSDSLASYASERASFFASNGSMDEHAGFRDFLDNQDGFNKLGFNSVGENSAYLSGGPLTGTHIIEWLFAADPLHDANQLEGKWTHVGIGISGPAVDVIFGGRKQ